MSHFKPHIYTIAILNIFGTSLATGENIAICNLYQNKLCDSISSKNQAFNFQKFFLITMWFYDTM